jgi:hypothetical protein
MTQEYPSDREILREAIDAVQEQRIFSYCLFAVLLEREIARSSEPETELRMITERVHQQIDEFQQNTPMEQSKWDKRREMTHMLVDSVSRRAGDLHKDRK